MGCDNVISVTGFVKTTFHVSTCNTCGVALCSQTLPQLTLHALYVHGQGPVHEQCSSSVVHVTTSAVERTIHRY